MQRPLKMKSGIQKEDFGATASGEPVQRYVLTSPTGLQAAVITYGAALQMLKAPDADGKLRDIAPGFSTVQGYEAHTAHFGALIGRSCGRISGGRLPMGDQLHLLSQNAAPHHLHGGVGGFDRRVWTARVTERGVLELSLRSADKEEGYPGALRALARYRWRDGNSLLLELEAQSDSDTICNLTTHAYFNLAGHDSGDILGHYMRIHARRFIELDQEALPTGRVLPLAYTPQDFSEWRALRNPADWSCARLKSCCYLPGGGATRLRPAAELWEPTTGRMMQLMTPQPALHFYSGYLVKSGPPGKDQALYKPYCGLCLEPQTISDGMRYPNLPSPLLKKGAHYRQSILYRFKSSRSPPWTPNASK